ncbi:class I tRNA ligase family protein, partial [uncultured Dubosiella sp.]
MKLYNSYTQKIEPLKPIEEGKVSMYVCGPTVYNYPHIGNVRPIIVFDTLKKALEAQGLDVTYVSNYTDVDDKIIHTAIEQNTTEKEITTKFIAAYDQTRADLNADMPNVAPKVTETMDEIIAFIKELIEAGAAYEIDGDVYYRVGSNPKYGELSHQKIEDLMVGARI